jgi:hypothetical protein
MAYGCAWVLARQGGRRQGCGPRRGPSPGGGAGSERLALLLLLLQVAGHAHLVGAKAWAHIAALARPHVGDLGFRLKP